MTVPFERLESLYHAARLRPAEERGAFLTEACGSDKELRREVESLLGQHAATGGFLAGVPHVPALAAGTRIGIYRITAQLGAGGMGEVYQARDTKLGRDVAIKVLPRTFAADPDRLTRFEREARVLAALNHPNIAQIYGFEDSGGVNALVMELIDGETLWDRLRRGPIPLADAIPIARQIAEALEAAHDKAIIHRDVKPSNVALTRTGVVKVLDFGLAKATVATVSDARQSPTVTVTAAGDGILLGTAAYMSPEQARGRAIDKRTDIWAFGCVLYEMITGRMAFDGATTSDHIAAVLEREPDWSALPPETPARVRQTLRSCLEKDPRSRCHDIADARLQLDERYEPVSGPAQGLSRTAVIVTAVAALVSGLGAASLFLSRPHPSAAATPVRLAVELGAEASMPIEVGPNVALAPDGSTLAFVALTPEARTGQLYVRRLDQLAATPLPGTEDARNPFFSPDGRWVAFFDMSHGKLKKVSVAGGLPVTLCDAPGARGGTWVDDDSIVLQTDTFERNALVRVAAAGGSPEPFVKAPAIDASIRWPQVLPGGKAVLYTAGAAGQFEAGSVFVQAVNGGEPRAVVRNGYYGHFVETGHILHASHGSLFATPFNVDRLEVTGPPVQVVEGVSASAGTGSADFAVSRTGMLMYVPSTSNNDVISTMDRSGTVMPLLAVPGICTNPVFSPDAGRFAMEISDGTHFDVWVYDLARETWTKITHEDTDFTRPVWTPDGRRVAFGLKRDGSTNLYLSPADGSGEPQRLTRSPNRQEPWSWHPSGKFLSYFERHPDKTRQLMVLPMSGDAVSGWKAGEPRPLLSTSFDEANPMFSPDGRWIAYTSKETGHSEVFVHSFPGAGPTVLISAGGGDDAHWSRAQNELLFRGADNRIMVASYRVAGNSFRADKPRLWSPRPLPKGIMRPLQQAPFDVFPDGNRIALFVPPEAAPGQRDKVVLVFDFLNELRRSAQRTP
jgi:serine/threonine-protein kinase